MKNSLHNEASIVTQEYNIKGIGDITLTTSSELLSQITNIPSSGTLEDKTHE